MKTVTKYISTWFLLFIVHCSLCTAPLQAQDSGAFLKAFVQKMSDAPVAFNFTFTYENRQNGTKEEHPGSALCDGERFRILMKDVEVYCDGETKWVYNKQADELMLFPAAEAHDITDNPLQYIRQHADDFKYKSKVQRTTEQAKPALHLDLHPRDKKAVYISVGLTVAEATYYPLQIQYTLKDGQRYTITITDFAAASGIKASTFVFPKQKYPDAALIDLRKKAGKSKE